MALSSRPKLGLHGLGASESLDHLFALYQCDRGLLGPGAGRGGGHFVSWTGTFFSGLSPLSSPRWATREMGPIGGYPQLLPENRTESSWGFIRPCPMATLLHTSLPNGEKEGRVHLSNNFIHT